MKKMLFALILTCTLTVPHVQAAPNLGRTLGIILQQGCIWGAGHCAITAASYLAIDNFLNAAAEYHHAKTITSQFLDLIRKHRISTGRGNPDITVETAQEPGNEITEAEIRALSETDAAHYAQQLEDAIVHANNCKWYMRGCYAWSALTLAGFIATPIISYKAYRSC